MHTNTPTTEQLQALAEHLAPHSFITLTNSKTLYPDAAGSGLPLLAIETDLCSAVISLQGAHLLEFKTTHGDPLLWLSPNCNFTPGTALRGGVPLCLPWFGVNQDDPKKPKHGFARNRFWEVGDVRLLDNGAVEIDFLFQSDACDLFAYDFSAEIRMTLGDTAKIELTVNNTDQNDFTCSFALHNYHRVRQLETTRVLGLTGRRYFDNFENYAEKQQHDDLSFPGPVDRVYPDVESALVIDATPRIQLTHHNSPSVITWNPGTEATASISDIGEGNERYFVCVERGAVLGESWHIPAGESRSAWMEFKQLF